MFDFMIFNILGLVGQKKCVYLQKYKSYLADYIIL